MNSPQPPGGETARLFLALWPDDALRRGLLAWRDAWQWPARAALVAPDDLHLTLHFLGGVPLVRLPPESADRIHPARRHCHDLAASDPSVGS